MPTVVFIYRIENNPTVFYGKYVTDYISNDHQGLDKEVFPKLIIGLNEYRKKQNLLKINEDDGVKVGIISCSSKHSELNYSSLDEIECFDFYHCYSTSFKFPKNIYYVNGEVFDLTNN